MTLDGGQDEERAETEEAGESQVPEVRMPVATDPEDLSAEPILKHCPWVEYEGRARPRFGKILLIEKVGQGGMGFVYRGVHPRLHREVAVKILPLHLFQERDSLLERFEREARLSARVDSRHVVEVLDIDEEPESGCHYIVMEYVRGESARDWLKRFPEGAPETDALRLIHAVTKGLASAHREGVVHRDIKPSNVLIPYDENDEPLIDEAKLADLGLARAEAGDRSLTKTSHAMGTPGYMAPEQATDAKRAKKPADVFGMGATLYALLTGLAPYAGSSPTDAIIRTATGRHTPIEEERPDLTPLTQRLITVCLRRDPDRRFSDAVALAAGLNACIEASEQQDGERSGSFLERFVNRPEEGKQVPDEVSALLYSTDTDDDEDSETSEDSLPATPARAAAPRPAGTWFLLGALLIAFAIIAFLLFTK